MSIILYKKTITKDISSNKFRNKESNYQKDFTDNILHCLLMVTIFCESCQLTIYLQVGYTAILRNLNISIFFISINKTLIKTSL